MARPRILALAAAAVALTAAALPGAASASLSPRLTVSESAGTVAESSTNVGFSFAFNQTAGDAVKDATLTLPPGLLIDETVDGGACLTTTAPIPACRLGTGSAVIAGASSAVSVYLVKPPDPTALAGVELVAGPMTTVGTLAFRSSSALGIQPSLYVGEVIAFANLPAAPVSSLSFTLNGMTLPSSCQPAVVGLWSDSQQRPYPSFVTAPLTVTGCTTLAYEPTASERISRDPRSTAGVFAVNLVVPPVDSVSQGVKVQVPGNLTLSPNLTPCLEGHPCTVGAVAATSPVIPASQLHGTITLSGNVRGPALEIAFPTLNLQLATVWGSGSIGISLLPDIPMSTFTMTFTGNNMGRMFVIACYPASFGVTFTPRSGNPSVDVTGPVAMTGCARPARHQRPGKPQGRAHLSGWSDGAPKLAVTVHKGARAPGIRSVSIAAPSGLHFARAALVARGSGANISVSGAKLAGTRWKAGRLVIRFTRVVSAGSISLGGALLVKSAASRHSPGGVSIRVTDGRGRTTQLRLRL